MTKPLKSIAIYGGAFDPVHMGHINTAKHTQDKLHFDEFFFLPCKAPLLKNPVKADAKHRIRMLELALKDYSEFKIDQREIERDTPSYMIQTLKSYREDYPEASLTLIMGTDAFAKLPQWHEWEKILKLANIMVIYRPEYDIDSFPAEVIQLLNRHEAAHPDKLFTHQNGVICRINAGHYPISSTDIRYCIKNNNQSDIELPETVYQYIQHNNLYI